MVNPFDFIKWGYMEYFGGFECGYPFSGTRFTGLEHIGVALPIGIVDFGNDCFKGIIGRIAVIKADRVKYIIKIPGRCDHDDLGNRLFDPVTPEQFGQFILDRNISGLEVVLVMNGCDGRFVVTKKGVSLVEAGKVIKVKGIDVYRVAKIMVYGPVSAMFYCAGKDLGFHNATPNFSPTPNADLTPSS